MPPPKDIRGQSHLREYRGANLWCPLLKDGLCSVYDRRPAACRFHAATRHAALCADDYKRRKQEFIITDVQDQIQLYALNILTADEPLPRIQYDHLGIWLGHLLLGKTERSDSAMDIETI